MSDEEKIPIGISTCLLGENVRFDGGHKHDRYITGTLAQYFEWVSVCPEMDIGLGTPRDTIRFEKLEGKAELLQPKTGKILTDKMSAYAKRRVKRFEKQRIYGYILKAKSPSCGMERIKIYNGHGVSPATNGVGLYAQHLMAHWPNLPIEEEGRLCDPALRENWVNRVFIYYGFYQQMYPRPTVGKLVQFHARVKFAILSHCEETYREMGRLVATAKSQPMSEAISQYETLLMTALKKRSTAAQHSNVLEHMVGFFKKDLPAETRRDIVATIKDFKAGYVPLIVPKTLVQHYAKLHQIDYLMDQMYLAPHPKEMALQNRI